jgi:hypothetical protein
MGEAHRAARVVVLDLRELCFIDGSGVHVILDAADDCGRSGGRLLIVRGSVQVERVLALTEISKQVVIFDLAPGEPEPVLAVPRPQTSEFAYRDDLRVAPQQTHTCAGAPSTTGRPFCSQPGGERVTDSAGEPASV